MFQKLIFQIISVELEQSSLPKAFNVSLYSWTNKKCQLEMQLLLMKTQNLPLVQLKCSTIKISTVVTSLSQLPHLNKNNHLQINCYAMPRKVVIKVATGVVAATAAVVAMEAATVAAAAVVVAVAAVVEAAEVVSVVVAAAEAVVVVADAEVDSVEAVVVVAEDSMVVAVAADQPLIRKIVLPPQILDFLLNCSSLLFWSSFLDILSNSPQ